MGQSGFGVYNRESFSAQPVDKQTKLCAKDFELAPKMCLERHQELRKTTERKPRKLLRPRLPRKITTTCKINLNKFWEELEEVYRDTTTTKVLPMWPAESMVDEEQQNNENSEREKLKLQGGRLDRYVFLLPSLPPSPSPSPPSSSTSPPPPPCLPTNANLPSSSLLE